MLVLALEPTEAFERLQRRGVLTRLPRGAEVSSNPHFATRAYALATGSARIDLISPSGRERLLAYLGPRVLLGHTAVSLELPVRQPVIVRTLTPSSAVFWSREQLESALREDGALAFYLFRCSALIIHCLLGQLYSDLLAADARIAQALLELHQHYPGSDRYGIRVSQEELADVVGVSRVTVSLTLHRFAQLGAIRAAGKRRLVVLDTALLQMLAEPQGSSPASPRRSP